MSPDVTTHDSPRSGELRRVLPHRLRLLFVGTEEPPWALLALRLEAAGCAQAEFDWEAEPGKALARLRKVTFDCLVVRSDARERPSAVGFAEGLRASGSDDPVVVLTASSDDELTMKLDEYACELMVTTAGWHSRALVSVIRRAVARGDLHREMCGLEVTARRGRTRERGDAEAQLEQLRELLRRLCAAENGTVSPARPAASSDVVKKIEGLYHELLRTAVMMGSGNLGGELARVAELISLAGLSPVDALGIHLGQLEVLLQGLGSRSSRHVTSRADLLALELLIQLGESYRCKSPLRGLGAAGVDLLHAQSLLQRPRDGAV